VLPVQFPPPEDPAVKMARLLANHRADAEETAKLVEIRARYDAVLKEMDLYENRVALTISERSRRLFQPTSAPTRTGMLSPRARRMEADETTARGNESQAGGDEDVSAARGDDMPAVRRSSRQRRPKQLDLGHVSSC